MRKIIKNLYNNDIVFTSLGGVSEVGATSHYIIWKGTKIIIDAGMRRNIEFKDDLFENRKLPEFDEIDEKIDYILITHPHYDHIGSLPIYSEKISDAKIIMSKEALEITKIMIKDTRKILKKDKNRESKWLKPFYETNVLKRLYNKIITIDFNEEYFLKILKLKLFPTAHTLGSAAIFLYDNTYKLLHTSDFVYKEMFIHRNTHFFDLNNIDTLIIESTYASHKSKSKNYKEILEELKIFINKILENNGSILIPVFSLARGQEVIAAINLLKKQSYLKKGIPVYVLGKLFHEINMVYDIKLEDKIKNRKIKPLSKSYTYIDSIERFFPKPGSITIATSAMLNSYTPSYQLLPKFLNAPNGIIFVSYQS
ncbi:RNA processing exonuclease, beta-lactamase fold, Cft2 family, partial [Marinitoga hydrogenitolerans DSM 16785]